MMIAWETDGWGWGGRSRGGRAAAEKARSPQVRHLVLMIFRVFALADLKATDWCVEGEEV